MTTNEEVQRALAAYQDATTARQEAERVEAEAKHNLGIVAAGFYGLAIGDRMVRSADEYRDTGTVWEITRFEASAGYSASEPAFLRVYGAKITKSGNPSKSDGYIGHWSVERCSFAKVSQEAS